MKKVFTLVTLCCMLLAMMTGCGGAPEAEAEENAALTPEKVEALVGTTLPGAATVEARECALMVTYLYHGNTQEEIEAYAKEAGYVPIATSGEGEKVYALMPNESGFAAVVLGETDSLHPSVESGGTRRFAERYVLWKPLSGTDWKVEFVEKQDYYEADGAQYPCYMIGLSAAK